MHLLARQPAYPPLSRLRATSFPPAYPPARSPARLPVRPLAISPTRPPACCKRQLARMVAGESHSQECPQYIIFLTTMALKTMVLFIVRVFDCSPGQRSVQSEHDGYSEEEKNDTTTFFFVKSTSRSGVARTRTQAESLSANRKNWYSALA